MNILNSFGRKRLICHFRHAINNLDKKKEVDKVQERVIKIFNKVLSFEETELMKEQSMLYIHWSHITIKLSIFDDRLVIMNGKYYYYLSISSHVAEKLRHSFYRKINKRLGNIENRFNSSIIKNLENVLAEMNEYNEVKRF
jgi:hypothetical protein